jgi:hypothetical protein
LFGEHARELVSPESGLHFLETLCGDLAEEQSATENGGAGGDKPLASRVQELLKTTKFQVVVNGNPNSRRNVEQGQFCLRVNG